MAKQTYYVVQTTPTLFVHNTDIAVEGFGIEKAARLSITEARQFYRRFKGFNEMVGDVPRRFPRIIKVTVETKTITERR